MTTYADLILPEAKVDWFNRFIDLVATAGFPTVGWQSGSVPMTILDVNAQVMADVNTLVTQFVNAAHLDTGTGDWLRAYVSSQYRIAPLPAAATVVGITLTDSGGGGPYTIVPGQLWVSANPTNLRYSNSAGGPLPHLGTLTLTFQAEGAGAAYNSLAASYALITPLPGVIPTPAGIVLYGVDAESDSALQLRAGQQWATLATSATADTYAYLAKTASPYVTQVLVAAASGVVTVTLGGSGGTVASSIVDIVRAALAPFVPLTAQLVVVSATVHTIAITGNAFAATALIPTVKAGVSSQLALLQAQTPIGSTVYYTELIERILVTTGARNVVLTAPLADVALGPSEAAAFDITGLTWHGV